MKVPDKLDWKQRKSVKGGEYDGFNNWKECMHHTGYCILYCAHSAKASVEGRELDWPLPDEDPELLESVVASTVELIKSK